MKFKEHDPLFSAMEIFWQDLARSYVLGRYNDPNLINDLFDHIHEEDDPLAILKATYERNTTDPQLVFETLLGFAYTVVRSEPEDKNAYRKRLHHASEQLRILRENK